VPTAQAPAPTPTAAPGAAAFTATASPTPLGESIYFLTKNRNRWQVYAIGPDGEGLRRVSDPGSSAWGPTASGDGRIIGYTSDRGGSVEFWASEPSGANARALSHGGETSIPADPEAPPRGSFSPDGSAAAWLQRGEIWIGDVNGLNPETLVSHLPYGTVESVWFSPAGWEVAYHLRRGTPIMSVWTVPVSGRKPVRRTDTELRSPHLAWHPSGRQFYFWKEGVIHHTLDIGDKLLVQDEARVSQVAAARDGSGIAYIQRDPAGAPGGKLVYIATGKEPVTVVDAGAADPAFSPDGRKLALRLEGDIWTIGVDGSGRRRLTVVGGWHPVWVPALGEPPSAKAGPAAARPPKKARP
jgi:Tol biopolymer transport system component